MSKKSRRTFSPEFRLESAQFVEVSDLVCENGSTKPEFVVLKRPPQNISRKTPANEVLENGGSTSLTGDTGIH